MRTIALIQCRNEAKHIEAVVKGSAKYTDVVFVADDSSTDDTAQLAKLAGAIVYQDTERRKGINKVIQKMDRNDILVLLDGDGQHDPDFIPSLLMPILEQNAEIVIGNRMKSDGIPRYRRFGINLLSAANNIGHNCKLTDAVSGYMAIRRYAIPHLTAGKWAVCSELLIKARANGMRIVSVPVIVTYYKDYQDNSSLSPLRLGSILLWTIIKWRFKCEVRHEAD
jgi:glycosyltransferase involved in cell wall biosynthesis